MQKYFVLILMLVTLPMYAGSLTYVKHAKDGLSDMRWTVSSVLPAQGGHDFGPKNFVTKTDAWCESAPGNGVGQWVKLIFSENRTFDKVALINGYAKSKRTFKENNRARRIMLRLSNGKTYFFKLKDTLNEQMLTFPEPQTASWLKLTILSVFRGREFQDTCLTKFTID